MLWLIRRLWRGALSPSEVGVTPLEGVSAIPVRKPGGVPTHLPLAGQVWAMAKWPLAEQMLGFGVWIVDLALAGRLSTSATNALGVATYITWLMGLLEGAVGIGAMALVARAVGGSHRRLANAALGQAALIALVWGAAIGLATMAATPLLTRLSNLDPASEAECIRYLWWVCSAAPMMALLFIGGACLRASGDFRSVTLIMLWVTVVNAVVSYSLVRGPGWLGGHGIDGIALGTVAAWVVGGLMMLARLRRGNRLIRLHWHRMKPHRHTLRRLTRLAFPSLLDTSGLWLGNFVVIMIVGQIGGQANLQGAHVIAIRIEGLSFLPGFAFAQAAATMVGQYLGAGDRRMAVRSAWACWSAAAGFMTVLGLIFVAIPGFFVRLLTDEPVFLETCPDLLRLAGLVQIGLATSMVFGGSIRGAGDTRGAMAINYGSTYLVRMPLAYLFGIVMGGGLWGVWLAMCLELMVRGGLFLTRFLRGRWKTIEV